MLRPLPWTLFIALAASACVENSDALSDGGADGATVLDGSIQGDGEVLTPCQNLDPNECADRDDCLLVDGASPYPKAAMVEDPIYNQVCIAVEDAACAALPEEACATRLDCAIQATPDGAFTGCVDLGQVGCEGLDLTRCRQRDDCRYEAGECLPEAETCADFANEAGCLEAGCYFYDRGCHAEPSPARCDQPDPASCESMGCRWTDEGCRPNLVACGDLGRVSCQSRQDCEWNGNFCQEAAGECAQLDAEACLGRPDCQWTNRGCIEQSQGTCGELDEASCAARPDCEPVYDYNDCGGGAGGAAGVPEGDPAEPCGNLYRGCAERVLDCGALNLDVCLRTPGCHIESVPVPCDCNCEGAEACGCACPVSDVCVADSSRCADLSPDACAQDPGCELVTQEICDWDGDGVPDDNGAGGAQAGGAEGDRAQMPPEDMVAPCQVVTSCQPRAQACQDIRDWNQCAVTAGCEPVDLGFCGAPMPCDCADGEADCVCDVAVACFECRPTGGQICEALSPDVCEQTDGCHLEYWGEFCDCREGPDGQEECACWPGEPVCVTDVVQDPCNGFPAEICAQIPGCQLLPQGEQCECRVDENGQEVCACWGGEPLCVSAPVPVDPCQNLSPDVCESQLGCRLEGVDVACDCDPDGNCPPCQEFAVCVLDVQELCYGSSAADCPSAYCHVEMSPFKVAIMPAPFACVPGQAVCEGLDSLLCEANPGVCAWNGDRCLPLRPLACEQLDVQGCLARPECQWMDGGVALPCDCPEGGPCVCPDPMPGFCTTRGPVDVCAQRSADACERDFQCGVVYLPTPCACDPADPNCAANCEPVPVCQPIEQLCADLGPVCDDPRCVAVDQQCGCEEGATCDCGGGCVPASVWGCQALTADACQNAQGCVLVEADGREICLPVGDCSALTEAQCAAHPSCQVVQIDCDCEPGAETCVDCEGGFSCEPR